MAIAGNDLVYEGTESTLVCYLRRYNVTGSAPTAAKFSYRL